METLKQTLMVPKNHTVHFEVTLPENFPIGLAEVILVFAPKISSNENIVSKNILTLAGSLKDSPNFSGDPLTLQKGLRDEWEK